jgi:hypothetical protein
MAKLEKRRTRQPRTATLPGYVGMGHIAMLNNLCRMLFTVAIHFRYDDIVIGIDELDETE